MKSVYALILALVLPSASFAQSNIFQINYMSSGPITRGPNRCVVYPASAKSAALAPAYAPADIYMPPNSYGVRRDRPKTGDVIKYSLCTSQTDKSPAPICAWQVKGVTNLGSVILDADGQEIAKTKGSFLKVSICVSSTGDVTLRLNSNEVSIETRTDAKDTARHGSLPHLHSNEIVGEDERVGSIEFVDAGKAKLYSVVYEVPADAAIVFLRVFSLGGTSRYGFTIEAMPITTSVSVQLR